VSDLNPDRALIFRIVHVDNLPWILDHGGLHSRNWPEQSPDYVNIGNPDLIDKRSRHTVPVPPGGTLSDYVPFYFTPKSMMLFNIHTGYGGVPKRENQDLVIFVSSVRRIHEMGLPFVFTNQHAYAVGTQYFSSLDALPEGVDWSLLRSENFKADDADPGRGLRYQAEALVHGHVPLAGLLGIGCWNDAAAARVNSMIEERGLAITVRVTPNMFFR